jgi:nucleotide-binding universal stress UspA family protein
VLAIPAEAPHAAAAAGPCRLLENILVPYDGSELAWRAVEMLVLMGAAGKGKVTLLGVVETLGGRDAVQEARIPHDLASTYLKLRCDGMQEDLEKAAARARDLGLDAVGMHDLGRPAERIILRAEASGATLIAMTTHGRAGISRWLMGSVTEQVLRATTVPLLVCR